MSEDAVVDSPASRHHSLQEWFSKLSAKLQRLVQEAENQAWPFVYEEWQFEQDTKKESVNIKDLVLSKNAVYPDMLEKDVLKVSRPTVVLLMDDIIFHRYHHLIGHIQKKSC
jgi:hypothetical protein